MSVKSKLHHEPHAGVINSEYKQYIEACFSSLNVTSWMPANIVKGLYLISFKLN